MNRELISFKITITVIKTILLVAATWMFLSLLLSITDAVKINDFLFGKEGHSRNTGDYGVIITLTTWSSFFVPLLVKGKLDKIFCGIFLSTFSLICFIGTLVTSASAATFLGWSIPTLVIFAIGILWILEGTNVINLRTGDSSHNARHKNKFHYHKKDDDEDEDEDSPSPTIPTF